MFQTHYYPEAEVDFSPEIQEPVDRDIEEEEE